MFKIETHIHTAEVSACSRIKAKEMVKKYHAAGYSTIFITDHFQENSLDVLGDLPWNEKMTVFLSGYYRAKFEGDKLGITVLPGAEMKFADSKNHYLVYGITKEFLDTYPNIHEKTLPEFSKIAKENGIFVVQAHPHRDGACFPTPEYVDAIEVYNSNPRHDDHSELSEALVKELGIPVTVGSDAHRDEDVAGAALVSEKEIKTVEEFILAVRSGALKIEKTPHISADEK